MRIQLVHPVTGAQTRVGIGFSWPILALAFGLWLCVTVLFLAIDGRSSGLRNTFTSGVMMAFAVYFAREFNGHRGRRLLMQGWRFAEPSAPTVRLALRGWQVPDLSQVAPAMPAEAPSPPFSIDADRFLAACAAPLPPQPQALAPAAPVFIPPSPSGGPMKVQLINPRTGELKAIKVGFSWTLFFFSGFFGLPLFLRKLHYWGLFFLLQPVLFNLVPDPPEDKEDAVILGVAYLIMLLIQLGLYVFMAIKGNEMTAKNLLEKGWRFAHRDAIETQIAKRAWGLM